MVHVCTFVHTQITSYIHLYTYACVHTHHRLFQARKTEDEKEEGASGVSKLASDVPDESMTSILMSKPYNLEYEVQVRFCMSVYVCVYV
jgi:hypothetical protein